MSPEHGLDMLYREDPRVQVVKARLDLTGKYPNINKGRIGFLDECN